MSARSERDRLAHELEAARKRIADLETALLRRDRDTLTAVLRIEGFREQLVEELLRTRRRGLQGALVVLQVDRLSDIHRDHGFGVGDAALGALVDALRAGTRGEDVIGRTGDDRFALLLREAGEAATSACVARLLGDLQALEIGAIRGISVSAGVALFGPEDDDPVRLFETAGRALANAQAGGGGRAVIATGDGAGLGVTAELHRRDAVEALAIALLDATATPASTPNRSSTWRSPWPRAWGCRPPRSRTSAPVRSCTTSARSASPTRSSTSRGR